MKRVISAVLVLLALGAAAFFFLKMRRYLPERPRGAELAPPETIFFAQFPNLRQTALRAPQSDLYQIWREPDVQAFLEKPRRKAPWMRAWTERFDEMVRVAPGEAFVALTSIEGPRPSFVAGFSFAGSRGNAEVLATHLREQLLSGGEVVSSFRSNWYLCASDSVLLEAVLARFDGKPSAALAATSDFQQSTAPLGAGQDLVLFGKPAALAGRLDLLAGLGGSSASDAQEAVAMATKIDGTKLHDTIFLRRSGPDQAGAVSRQALSLASSQTVLYYGADLSLFRPAPGSGLLKSLVPGLVEMEKRLAEKGLNWDDLPAAIGPEVGLMADWPEDAALPALLVASEIRDPAKARTFMEVLTNPPAPGAVWQREELDGVTVLRAPLQGFSFMRPTVALTERFALLGMSPEAVTGALPKAGVQLPLLEQTAAFQDVARFIPPQASAFAYLDFQRLFERVYRMARPVITLSLAFSAEAGAQLDAGKLPPVESISRHLGATVFTQTQVENGTVIESIGSLTLPELLAGVGAGGMASGLPDLAGALPGGIKQILPGKAKAPSIPPAGPGAGARSTPAPAPPEKTVP